MKKRRVFSILIAIMMLIMCVPVSYAETAASETVVPEGYTAIYTKEDLTKMRDDLSGKYILMDDITFVLDDFIKSTENPDRRPWVPIGASEDTPFTGEFNGNGHTITGLISVCYNKELVAGLFGYLKGSVHDLNMAECSIQDSGERGYEMFAGGIAGVVDGGSVTNCSVSGEVISLYYCGGIAGKIINNAMISGCSSSAVVKGDGKVAGIAGYGEYSTIENSHNSGEINLIRADYTEGENSAGILARGYNMNINNCSNTGEMSGQPYYSGGIAGYMTGKISNSYNDGQIYARTGGGIAGYLSGEVTDCYNNGALRNKTIGGIVGTLYGDAYNCYNTGKIEGNVDAGGITAKLKGNIRHSYNTGEIVGTNAGGITGNMALESSVEECYNTGLVWGESNSGGIAGVMEGGRVEDSYNTGIIHSGDGWCDSVGGIAGSAVNTADISTTYNLGSIKRRNLPGSAYKSPLGMIVGYYPEKTANLTDNYVHVRANEGDFLDEDKVVIEDAIVLTTKSMKQAESFAGFDFESVWTVSENGDYPFPQLKKLPMTEGYDCGFDIDGIHMRDLDIQMETEFQYTKKAIEPEIVVKDGEKILTVNEHYSVEFSNNIDAGTATAKITGLNGYEGSVKKSFEITPKPYDNCRIDMEYTEVTYNGGVHEPEVRVFDEDGEELQITKDFVAIYEFWPEYVGKYTVQVIFKGNYTGETEKYYTVIPRAPKSASANLNSALSLKGYDDITFKWAKVEEAAGYDIYFKKATASKYTFMTSTTKTSVTKKDLADGVKYNFKVVPYGKEDGEKIVSKNAKVANCYTLKKVNTPKVSRSDTRVKVKWTNINGETGYQVSQAKTKTGTKIVSTIKSSTATYKNVAAAKGKTFYYKVRAYKTVNGNKVFGPWSSAVKFKR